MKYYCICVCVLLKEISRSCCASAWLSHTGSPWPGSLLVCSLLPFDPSHQLFHRPPSCHGFVSLSLEDQAVLFPPLCKCLRSGWMGLWATWSSDGCPACGRPGGLGVFEGPFQPNHSIIFSIEAPLKLIGVLISSCPVPGVPVDTVTFLPMPMGGWTLVPGSKQSISSSSSSLVSPTGPAQRSGGCPLGKIFGLPVCFPGDELGEP